jgi:DNA excision repair protein ERCC-3
LPNATVLIQLSGAFGSRQEEAQRLGRVLRIHHGQAAFFYALMTTLTREIQDNWQRQRFLVAQGYRYTMQDGATL